MYKSMYEAHTDKKGETNEKEVFKQLHKWAGNSNFGITAYLNGETGCLSFVYGCYKKTIEAYTIHFEPI